MLQLFFVFDIIDKKMTDDDILGICEYYFLIHCGSYFELRYWDEEPSLNGHSRSEEPPLRASS